MVRQNGAKLRNKPMPGERFGVFVFNKKHDALEICYKHKAFIVKYLIRFLTIILYIPLIYATFVAQTS